MSVQTVEILEQLKSLNLIETDEVVKQNEDTFNVDASRAQTNLHVVIVYVTDEKEAENQQTEFDVVLEEVPSNKKIAILKLVRGITGLSLKDTKDFFDDLPQAVKSGIVIAEAQDIKQQLEAAGAFVSLK